MRHIEKRFGPVRANRDVALTVQRATVHGIVEQHQRFFGRPLLDRSNDLLKHLLKVKL